MENRKRQYSRMVIEEAFLSQFRRKPLECITVTELCRQANVNRSTFYSNYLDVYDLMDQVADRFFKNLFDKCISDLGEPNPNGGEDSIRFIKHALNVTLEERELCRLLVGSTHRRAFIQKLLDTLLEWSMERYKAYCEWNSEYFIIESTLMFGGTLVLWQRWIEEDFKESPEVLAQVINEYLVANTRRIWGAGQETS